MPVLAPALADRCVVVNGVAKTYAMTGWRVGWMIGPNDVVKAATNLQSTRPPMCNVAQAAALAAVSGDLAVVDEMRTAFDRRRRTIVAALNGSRRHLPGAGGAFYAYPSVKGVLGRDIRGAPADHHGPGRDHPRPGRGGGGAGRGVRHSGYLRLSYALGDDDLVEGSAASLRCCWSSRPGAVHEHRFGDQGDAESVRHSRADPARQLDQVAGGGSAPVGQGQGVLRRKGHRSGRPVPLGEAGLIDQPGGADLHATSGCEGGCVVRQLLGHLGATIGLVKNDPALQVSWSAPVQDHPFASTELQDGVTHLIDGNPITHPGPQAAGQFR